MSKSVRTAAASSASPVVYARVPSPLGELLLTGDGEQLTGLYLPDHRRGPRVGADWHHDPAPFAEVARQLEAYLDGRARGFDLPLRLTGTAVQLEVWDGLQRIPYGATVTYGELARAVGRPGAARAVAGAVARNPISIVVPCHRVVGAGGTLTGYAGGIERKRWLLDLEARGAR